MIVDRLIGRAKAPQIDRDDPVIFRQGRLDRLPCEARCGKSVEQKDGLALPLIHHRKAQRPRRRIHGFVFDLELMQRHHWSARD